MKDWNLEKSYRQPSKLRLVHDHPYPKNRWNWSCLKQPSGKWFCDICNVYAPEEISFVADLANCVQYELLS